MSEPTTIDKIAQIPEGFETLVAVPKPVKQVLGHTEQTTPCGMPFALIWNAGPRRGLPVTGWCAEPLCLRPGEAEPGPCTGPRFVPHLQQYTTADPLDPARKQRGLDAREIVESVRRFGEKATRITKVRDHRSDREIAHHVVATWTRLKRSVKGEGGWGGG